MLMLIIQISVVFLLIYLYLVWNFQYWKNRNVLSAKAYPIFGSFPKSFMQKLNICYEQMVFYKQYRGKTPFIGIMSGRTPQLMILDSLVAKDILVKDFKNFHDNEVASLTDKESDPIFARNPFMLAGEEWKEKRAEITPAFTHSKLKAMYPVIDDVCTKMTKFVHQEIKKQHPEGIDAKELAAKYTTDVVSSCIYGVDSKAFSDEESVIRKVGSTIFEPNLKFLIYFLLIQMFPFIMKIYRMPFVSQYTQNFFMQLMEDAIKLREDQKIERDDYLNYLLQLKKKKNLPHIDMVAHTITFFLELLAGRIKIIILWDRIIRFAYEKYQFDWIDASLTDGFETSSIAIAHMLYYLAANKSVQDKLRKEINDNIGENGRIDLDVLNDMQYMDQAFHETLRKNPPAGISSKVCTSATELTDYEGNVIPVEKGTVVQIPIYCIHHDERIYSDPDTFNPDRFSAENGGLKAYKDKGAFLAFLDGPRQCLGMRFALAQSKAAVAEIIRNFEVTVNPKTQEPLVLDPKGFLLLPVGGLWLNFQAL